MRRPHPVLAIVAASALLASACGNDNKASNAYVDAVNRAQNSFASSFDKLSDRITSTSTPEQDQRTLDGFKRAVDRTVADLRAINVPARVKAQHRQLIDEIASYGRQIDRARTAFASENPQAIVKAQTRLVGAVTRVSAQINRTIDTINKKLRKQ
jgi:hypothetical protein